MRTEKQSKENAILPFRENLQSAYQRRKELATIEGMILHVSTNVPKGKAPEFDLCAFLPPYEGGVSMGSLKEAAKKIALRKIVSLGEKPDDLFKFVMDLEMELLEEKYPRRKEGDMVGKLYKMDREELQEDLVRLGKSGAEALARRASFTLTRLIDNSTDSKALWRYVLTMGISLLEEKKSIGLVN